MRASGLALLALLLGIASPAGPGPLAAVAGSAEAGRELFIGARRLRNGGAPCGACHALGGQGLAFTASLGPELSAGVSALDPASLDGLLETLPFPTMTPIYDARPLTAAERADLVAFLVPAAERGPPRDAWRFEAWGAGVAGLFFLGLALAWRRRKGSARARLLARAARLEGGSP
ncbi:MAG TPA: hypothetical protein VFF02_19235 [Anaeromyxobacteraceae bacterium]|nr:hypothetical protein [Anaeromyxobacteraceae bacterium]